MRNDLNTPEIESGTQFVDGQQMPRYITESEYLEDQFIAYQRGLGWIAGLDKKYKDDLANEKYLEERNRLEAANEKIKDYTLFF